MICPPLRLAIVDEKIQRRDASELSLIMTTGRAKIQADLMG